MKKFSIKHPGKFIGLIFFCLWALETISLADTSKAYQHLCEVMDRCADYFYVYLDQDSGCNHFFPSGWMGDTSVLSFKGDETNCGAGENFDPGTSCIKITFTAHGNNWAGIYWQQPENNWGNIPNAGYDLTGATKLTFWARGEKGGEEIEFFLGGIEGSYGDSIPKTSLGYITLTPYWQKYTIDLTGKDLSYVIGGFGWVTNALHNPDGATFYLDQIRFDKARPELLRFLASYETLPQLSPDQPDKYLKNVAFIYDNALALIAFLARGAEDDLLRAKILADAFVYALKHDRYYTDGRLRNAYMSGDLADRMTGHARLPGWWNSEANRWQEDKFQISTHTGNLAWVIIALLHYYQKVGGEKYLQAATALGEWIVKEAEDSRCQGGYTGGYLGWEPEPQKLAWKSTEHNIDIYVAFMLLYQITGDEYWHEKALHARRFVEDMWTEAQHHFWTGTLEDGCNINQINGNIPLDIQAWAVMAFRDSPTYHVALSWAEENCLTTRDGFQGFDFNNDRDGIWFEGTAQVVVAYRLTGQIENAYHFLEELRKAQIQAPNTNGKGIVAASHDHLSTGFDWEYFSRLHVGATAWYLFAEMGYNPYWGVSTSQYTLSVVRSGTGSGTITSDLAGINCGDVCSASFHDGTQVTITATVDPGSTFSSWGGDCSSCGNNTTCTITMNNNKTCWANFLLSIPSIVNNTSFTGGVEYATNHLELAFVKPEELTQPVDLYISLTQPSRKGNTVNYYFAPSENRVNLPNGIYFNNASPTTDRVPYYDNCNMLDTLQLYGPDSVNPIFNDGWIVPHPFTMGDGVESCQYLPDGDYTFTVEAYEPGTDNLLARGEVTVILDRECE